MLQWQPYTTEYYQAVTDCLKRNFLSVRQMSDSTLKNWMQSLTDYPWIDKEPINSLLYKRGVVLKDGDAVVGYLGLIYSYQTFGDKQLITVNPTTWAIDEKYRITALDAIKKTDLTAQVTYNLTPIANMQRILSSVFHYKVFEEKIYTFNFRPFIKKSNLVVQMVDVTTPDLPQDILQKLTDHAAYPIKCVRFNSNGQAAYLFYKIKKGKRKKIIPYTHITVLETDNIDFFKKNASDVIRALQKAEKATLITDSRFFGGDAINCQKIDQTKPVKRMKVSKEDAACKTESLLYSEIAILN